MRGTHTRFIPILVAASLGAIVGCKHESNSPTPGAEKPRSEMRELVDRLDKSGFFRFCETRQAAERAKQAVLEGRSPLSEPVGRSCPMDTEKLALGGGRDFVEACAPVFAEHGVKIEKVEQVIVISDSYYVFVNGEEFVIYTEEDTYDDKLWDIAAKGTLMMGNGLLRRAGSDEQLYMLNRGHDAVAVFLTEEQFRILHESLMPETEKPWPATAILKP